MPFAPFAPFSLSLFVTRAWVHSSLTLAVADWTADRRQFYRFRRNRCGREEKEGPPRVSPSLSSDSSASSSRLRSAKTPESKARTRPSPDSLLNLGRTRNFRSAPLDENSTTFGGWNRKRALSDGNRTPLLVSLLFPFPSSLVARREVHGFAAR